MERSVVIGFCPIDDAAAIETAGPSAITFVMDASANVDLIGRMPCGCAPVLMDTTIAASFGESPRIFR